MIRATDAPVTDMPDFSGRNVFALHIRRWKSAILNAYFPHARFSYLPLYIDDATFKRDWAEAIKAADKPVLLTWGTNISPAVIVFAGENNIPLYFIEDGFIRSLVPNASHSAPFSLALDSRAPYFDCRRPSDLEVLLNSYDFDTDTDLISRASQGISTLLSSRLSKYNSPGSQLPASPRQASGQRRVLVIGQVEDDASIRVGYNGKIDNNDVVRLAAAENPGCEILYRPHPDVLNGVRKRVSNPADVAHLSRIVTDDISLPELLEGVDHVYTITSLGGFEALLRGLPVTVLGSPFYAGWGLTDDRQPNPRRGRRLTIEQVFAAAYILYPHYFNPVTGETITFEECLMLALRWRQDGMPATRIAPVPIPPKRDFEITGPYGLLGWRHLMTAPLAAIIGHAGSRTDAENFRANPILFFRELSEERLRKLGRLLYPFD